MDFPKFNAGKSLPESNTPINESVKPSLLQGSSLIDGIPSQIKSRTDGIRLKTISGDLILNADDLSTGTMVLGTTGFGKTTLFKSILDKLIPGMTDNDVMIIFDSKGDYRDRYYDPTNRRHILVSPNENDEAFTLNWNIFRELFNSNGKIGKNLELIAKEISSALFKDLESSSQPFFNIAAEDIFSRLIASYVKDAMRTGDLSKLNNQSLCEEFFKSSDNVLKQTGKYGEYSYLKNYVGDGTSNQALGVYGYISTMISKKFVSIFGEKSKNGDFAIRELVRERGGKIIFLEYDINYSGTLDCLYSLFYDLAIKEALSEKRKNVNTYFICDELNLIPYVSRFEELLNFGRSKGCKTLVGLQSVEQLKKHYTEAEANSLLAGFVTAFCFNCVDYSTRTYVKERFGEAFELFNYAGANYTHEGFTISDSDIKTLGIGDMFIDMKGAPPFRTRLSK